MLAQDRYVQNESPGAIRRGAFVVWDDGPMSETVVVAVVGVLGTIISGLGAALVANRHSATQERLARRHELQDTARSVIVTVLVEARDWYSAASSVSMVVASASDLVRVDHFLDTGLSESESGHNLRVHKAAFERAATEANLLIADPKLSAAVSALLALHQGWFEAVITPVREDFEQGQHDKVERLRHWIAYDAKFSYGLAALERIATVAISSSLK